jgi:hypothetical protein
MEVGQGPNWGCSTKEKKMILIVSEDRQTVVLRAESG